MLTSDAIRIQLLGELQEATLDLDTILQVGEGIFESREHLQLYGMLPNEYAEMGVAFTGRTAIECTTDPDASSMARAVRQVLKENSIYDEPIVIDLFTGSGNLLFHVAKRLKSKINIGFENNGVIYKHTRRNFELINFPAVIENSKFETSIHAIDIPQNKPLVVIIDPPWENGFSFSQGLDLRKTNPPIGKILEGVKEAFASTRVFCMIKVFEIMNEASIQEVTDRCHICARGTSSLRKSGMNVGWMICRI